jgi:hypothetical protein
MLSKVDNLKEFAGQVCSDLGRRFPKAKMELYFQDSAGGRQTSWSGSLGDALACFKRHCGACTGALVQYNPNHVYGMVFLAICACDAPRAGCVRPESRLRILMTISHDGEHDVLLGRKVAPISGAHAMMVA